MKTTYSLNGKWKLYYDENHSETVKSPLEIGCLPVIDATVPGNVEIDLANAGIIDADLYKGMATKQNEKWETYDWWYETSFIAPEYTCSAQELILRFDGVDCFADYYLNDTLIASSENAFMQIDVDITKHVIWGLENKLHVHIRSAFLETIQKEYTQTQIQYHSPFTSAIRKSAHSFGWDIFPRAVSAGLWKNVTLVSDDGCSIKEFSYQIMQADKYSARIYGRTAIKAQAEDLKKDVTIKIKGVCGDDCFEKEFSMHHFVAASQVIDLQKPKLWWPYGYGEANVYDLTVTLYVDDEVRDEITMNMGIRTVELERTETLLEKEHKFQFVINGVPMMCKGSNWVCMDAYHSRDKSRYAKALELVSDSHCNILRVWGGGVYEQEEFYDYCDRHGIMVWQDFCMACIIPAMNDEIVQLMEKEFTYVVKSLRHHPSIILWAGDNEIDESLAQHQINPEVNVITRTVIPRVLGQHDNFRPYLPSSPYLSAQIYGAYGTEDIFPERHLWGARDYFKADFYKYSQAHFVSETGYHGCPSVESLKKIVDEDKLWPIYNEQWSLHSSDQRGSLDRVKLMENQIIQLFGFKPETIEDFSLASQFSQAEAKKYFIERIRIKKPNTSGVIWWNLIDGWPQMSDAVVDYFYDKKKAYAYIKRSQEPFALMMDEMHDWHLPLVASNDTLEVKRGSYKVYEVMEGKVYAEGDFEVDKNANLILDSIPLMYSDKMFLVIEWSIDGKKYFNHYLCGYPAFDFEVYKAWLRKFEQRIEER